MISENYGRVVKQIHDCLGKQKQNIIMLQYSNDFSLAELKELSCFQEQKEHVSYLWHEFQYHEISGGYDPFLDIICNAFRTHGDGDFSHFLSECGVYVPHREVLESYYRDGRCSRKEMVLLDEVAYEQKRMTEALTNMLRKTAEYCPMVVVLNRFQLASISTMELVRELLNHPSANIGIVLGVNDKPRQEEKLLKCWDDILEILEDKGKIYHIGNSDRERAKSGETRTERTRDFESLYRKINNTAALLDYDQAFLFFRGIIRGTRFEEENISDEEKLQLYPLYARISILRGDFATALEIIHVLKKLKIAGQEDRITCVSEYYLAMCRMYQGKLGRSYSLARNAKKAADRAGWGEMALEAELLAVQTQMSGWYNFFFCLQDIDISPELLHRLEKEGYDNFLAHIYVYAYDNDPKIVAKSCRQETELIYFNRGVALAQKIGNEHLVYNAYQKNIMIADTYGYYQAAVYYLLQSYKFVTDKHSLECGRIYSALGYNFSALGRHRIAENYYHQAIHLFLERKLPEDIAEVYYNMSLGSIMKKDFAKAESRLQLCIRTVAKLRLNSLRVCNLTKLYGLMALVCILQKDRFGCQRYLDDCGQLLHNAGNEGREIEGNHDYARLDDEQFLYWFSSALLYQENADLKQAYTASQKAETFLEKAKSNQFYAYGIFYEKRMELLRQMNHMEQFAGAQNMLVQYAKRREDIWKDIAKQVSDQMHLWETPDIYEDEKQIEVLLKQEEMTRELRNSRRRMEFLYAWQKLIDVNDMDIENMVSNAMYTFLNQFGNDCALYIRYHGECTSVLYNDTSVEVTQEMLNGLKQAMHEYPQGFAVSKISGNFQRHLDIISYFGEEKVCSFAAVPFIKSGRLESVMITYVLMKENWHASMESYMINEDDLAIYQLLFRELGFSVNRIEAYEKIYEMNQKLSHVASTDMLTGLYNRTGLYNSLEDMMEKMKWYKKQFSIGLMFIDLDNFKYYNDTYGHNVGDIILISMANVFREIIGTRGIVSRYGGDEFLIVLEENRKEEMEKIACDIYRKLEEARGFDDAISRVLGYAVEVDAAHKISCSIGIAMNNNVQEEEDIHELIKKADDILYSIKKKRKGTYAFFDLDRGQQKDEVQ